MDKLPSVTAHQKVQKLKAEAQFISGAEEVFISILATLIADSKALSLTCPYEEISSFNQLINYILRNFFGFKVVSSSLNEHASAESFCASLLGYTPKDTLSRGGRSRLGIPLHAVENSSGSRQSWAEADDDNLKLSFKSLGANRSQASDSSRLDAMSTSTSFIPSNARKVPHAFIIEDASLDNEHLHRVIVDIISRKQIMYGSNSFNLPKPFLFIFVLPHSASPQLHINNFLIERILLHHFIEYPTAASPSPTPSSKRSSSPWLPGINLPPSRPQSIFLRPSEILLLKEEADHVHIHPQINSYCRNIVVSLKLHPWVLDGISPKVFANFIKASSALATLSSQTHINPDIVHLAADKVLCHHLRLRKKDIFSDKHSTHQIKGEDPDADNTIGREKYVVFDVLERLHCPV